MQHASLKIVCLVSVANIVITGVWTAGAFGTLEHFTPSIDARYGNATSASDYLKKSQLAAYESHRAMFEGYSRNKYNATGLIQWMLNSAWPSNMWHLFDYYYQVGGSGFGVKKACAAPVHLLYSYPSQAQKECGGKECENDSDGYVWVVNSRYTAQSSSMMAEATVFSLDGKIILNHSQHLTGPIEEDSARKLFALNLYPPPSPPQPAEDCVEVQGTDTVEDQYDTKSTSSAKECCDLCRKDEGCTHSVFSSGSCYLKNMRHNDHENTMTPFRSEQCTLCLKREAELHSSITDNDGAETRNSTVLLRLRLTSDEGAEVVDESWYWLPPVLDKFEDPSSCFTGALLRMPLQRVTYPARLCLSTSQVWRYSN